MRIKISPIVLMLCFAVLLAGCDNNKSQSSRNTRTKQEQEAWKKATDTSSPKYSDEVLDQNRKPLP